MRTLVIAFWCDYSYTEKKLPRGMLMSNRCTFTEKKRTLSHYDAAAVMNAAVFKMLICRNEMHSSEPFAYCSQQRCITAALCFFSSMREEQADNVCRSLSVR